MRRILPRKLQAEIFTRDCWHCRYCGTAVFFSPALKALDDIAPGHAIYHRNGKSDQMTETLLNLCACVDHVLPVTRGGTNDPANLVCSCWKCNTAKSDAEPSLWEETLKEAVIIKAKSWDGLLSVLEKLEPENEWLKYFANRD